MKRNELKIPENKESISILLGIGGVVSYVTGFATQAKLLSALEISKDFRDNTYLHLTQEYGKAATDYAISYGEDVGAIMAVYGFTMLFDESHPAQLLKYYVLAMGTFVEIAQGVGIEDGTFSATDLGMYAIPLIFELIKLKKKFSAKG